MLKGILTLLSGSIFARLIGIASIPLLTRIYSPEHYGVLAIFVAFSTIMSTVFGLRFSQAVPLPKKDLTAFYVLVLSFFTITSLSFISFILLGVLTDPILDFFNAQELKEFWFWLVIASFSIAVFELLTMWSVRVKSYKVIASVQIKQSFLGELTKLIIGLFGFKPLGLILGHFIGQSFGIREYLKESFVYFKRSLRKVSLKRLMLVMKYYATFVYFRLPSDLLLILSVQAPVMISTKLYDSEITGQLGLTFMALALPISLLGAAVSRVYYAEISSIGRHNKQKIKYLTVQVQKKLIALAVPMTLVVYLYAEQLFGFVFGEQWVMAGSFASILTPYLLLQFVSSPLMQLVNVLGKQAIFLFLNGGRVVGLIVLYLLASTKQLLPEIFVLYLSLFLFLYYFVQSFVIFSLLKE